MMFIHRQAYRGDLKDQEWKWLKRFLPQPSAVGTWGRPQEWPMREIVNALLYLLRTGCQWRMLPHDLPPWQTVYYHHRKWRLHGLWEKINHLLMQQLRQKAGREATPSAAIVDAQSVKTTLVKGELGFDAGKRCTDANGISWSIPWGCCSRSWLPAAMCKTSRVASSC